MAVAYCETHENRDTYLDRERQLKRWTRAKKEALITDDAALLKAL